MKEHQNFQVSQQAIIIKNNKCLILKDTKKQLWQLPGGRINKLENPEPGFRREMKEELDIDQFEVIECIGAEPFYREEKKRAVCAIIYVIELRSFEVRLSEEHDDYRWISENELKNYEYILPSLSDWIKKAFNRKRQ